MTTKSLAPRAESIGGYYRSRSGDVYHAKLHDTINGYYTLRNVTRGTESVVTPDAMRAEVRSRWLVPITQVSSAVRP